SLIAGSGAETLYPPVRRCPNAGCKNKKLGNAILATCRVFTLHRGILPGRAASLYCDTCKTRYHYAFKITMASSGHGLREYYVEPLKYIHAQEASFVDRKLCAYIRHAISMSHTSTSDIGEIYDACLQIGVDDEIVNSPLLMEMAQDVVLEAFFMYSLLQRVQHAGESLHLLHNEHHNRRIDVALDQFNFKMAGTGQPHYLHACHDCLKFVKDPEGNLCYIRAAVTDGVTLGHPCCARSGCQTPLNSMKDRFCSLHRDDASKCAAVGCDTRAEQGFITCTLPAHRAEETKIYVDQISAYEDLRRRFLKANVPRTPKRKGRKSGRAVRRFTHHEQLTVNTCGVVTSRCSMFVSEGVASVREFLKKVYPEEYLLPTHIFYDNACHLLSHIQAQGDTHFKTARLIVDIFHARNHDDEFCTAKCNGASFPELHYTNKEGKECWVFNSSIAEQTNVWFGAFQAISREMSPARCVYLFVIYIGSLMVRYNFFLDEVISAHNERLVGRLEREGKQPFLLDPDVLKNEWKRRK
ncbi:hypothetical protein GGX14DRAFT_356063, partial [Mycena pura]